MAKITRRSLIGGFLAAGTAGGMGALLTAGRAPAFAQQAGATLRMLAYPYPVTHAIRDMLPEYQKQTGVSVEWEEAPYDQALSKQTVELVGKTGHYDLFVVNCLWLGAEAGTGQLLELDDMIGKAGATLDWNDFLPKQREMFTFKGKVYGIPISSNEMMGAYRKDVFARLGIKVPPVDASFTADEWMGIVKKVANGEQFGTSFPLKPMAQVTQGWSCLLMSAGGQFFDEKLTPVFNSKEGLRALEYLRELMNHAPKDILVYENQETNEAMMHGQVITQTLMWASRIPMIQDKEKSLVVDKVGWTMLPFGGMASGHKVGMGLNDGWAMTIPRASKHPKEAFNFAVWSLTKDKQMKFVNDTLVPATRASVFDRPELVQKNPWLAVMKQQLLNSFTMPIIPEWSEIANQVGTEIHAGLSGQRPLQQALDRANAGVADLLKAHGYPVGTWHGAKLPWQ